MDLTQEQRLLLLSTDPAEIVVSAAAVAPDQRTPATKEISDCPPPF